MLSVYRQGVDFTHMSHTEVRCSDTVDNTEVDERLHRVLETVLCVGPVYW